MEYKIDQFDDKYLQLKDSFCETLKNLSDVLIFDTETMKKILDTMKNQ
jgi:hypothetical protein